MTACETAEAWAALGMLGHRPRRELRERYVAAGLGHHLAAGCALREAKLWEAWVAEGATPAEQHARDVVATAHRRNSHGLHFCAVAAKELASAALWCAEAAPAGPAG